MFLFRSGALGLHGSDPPRTTLMKMCHSRARLILEKVCAAQTRIDYNRLGLYFVERSGTTWRLRHTCFSFSATREPRHQPSTLHEDMPVPQEHRHAPRFSLALHRMSHTETHNKDTAFAS